MVDWRKIISDYWVFAIIIALFLISFSIALIREMLDLIFNAKKINQLLRRSDNLDYERLNNKYLSNKARQEKINKSILTEFEKQIDYCRLMEKESSGDSSRRVNANEREKIIAAKRVTDIFKIR